MKTTLATGVFLGLTTVYLGIRAEFIRRGRRRQKVDKAGLADRLLVALTGVGQVLLPLLYVFTPWLAFADVPHAPACTATGAATMAGGLWLFWRAHADLGTNWSVTLEVDRQHRLVTRGVYRRIRHPMYAAFFLMAIGQALLLSNWLAGLAAFASMALLVAIRVPREEDMMIEQFGDEYRDYMRRTGGMVPRLSARA